MSQLYLCRACEKEIAGNASVCPHCGHRSTSLLTMILAAVIGIGILGAIIGSLQGPSASPAITPPTTTPVERNERELRQVAANELQQKFQQNGFDITCALGGPRGEKLALSGPGVTLARAGELSRDGKFRRGAESLGFTEVDFPWGGKLQLNPRTASSRQSAFDSVAAAAQSGNKAEVAVLRQIIEQAKPSLKPGDFEFLSAYVSLLEKGYFGVVQGCRAEGEARFHGDDRALMSLMRKSGLTAKAGDCIKQAAKPDYARPAR